MNKSDAQILTELLGGCWHEEYWENKGAFEVRKCRCNNQTVRFVGEHINPTYTNPADILNRMSEKLGEKKFKKFIISISGYHKDYFWLYAITDMIPLKYIEDVPSLVTKSIEFLEKEK